MSEQFWFNRMAEHWSIPERLDLVEHVRRATAAARAGGHLWPDVLQFSG